ncbi:iron complex outermembrane receptor protein [Sphingobium sp. B1D7B]|uniref:TonB-dependent receptor plug domain-containing protein n=1 Tax=unclassified Sphingobium TaxID=2611147 RepID=UPI0022250F03|nr:MULTISPECIES: TonB-dependent receptor [unclassified Sphingobium]MCW2391255.1 iron complex outermembrane receptor protein [Sphingobium sp. B11D3A]MCW2406466.1 iron complex outermembrane receptor protein [Sphingobium sp. B1D7B]
MKARNFSVRERTGLKLAVSASALVLAALGAVPAMAQQDASPQQGSSTDAADAAIIVTGTRIKGVAPVGSPVIPVGREEIEKLGVSTTNDALRKLPQIVNFGGNNEQQGGSIIQNTSLNSFAAKSINLRGLGTASTLSLVNGHRVAPQGANGQLFDADNIPAIALERIEVVADGGSAIYGSDAVGGVVNFIMRRPDNVFEVQARAGFADSVEEYIGSVAFGRRWSSGGFFLAYEYQNRTALEAADRPNLYNSDLSPYGGAPNPVLTNPGNVQFGSSFYGIPAGQNGTNVTLGKLTATPNRENAWIGADAIPSGKRHTVVGTFRQDFDDNVTFVADGLFSRRELTNRGIASTATLSVPNTNPFSPCAPGKVDDSATLNCPANGTLTVPYSFLEDLGPLTITGYEQIWSLSGGLEMKLSNDWNANVTTYYSENKGYSLATNQLNTNGLNRALGATVAGTTKPASVPFFNPFCDGQQFDCNSEATLALFRAQTELEVFNRSYGGSANIGGSLFRLPGGDVRVSVGGEIRFDYLFGNGQLSNTRTANVDTFAGVPTSNERDVRSVYAEAYVPLFGPDNARPGLEKLEFNAAVRYDRYSDVGSTTNPRFGVTYAPASGIQFRGSYGTSFRAPSLVDVNKYATAGFLPRTGSGSAVGLSPAAGSFQYVYPIGGNPDLKPETATTWSLGMDLTPELAKGFNFSLTYYNIVYKDKVDTAAYNAPIGAVLNSGAYDDFIVFNPVYFPSKTNQTLAQYVAYWNQITADPQLPVLGLVDPTTVIAIVDARRNNSGVVETDGFDVSLDYTLNGNGIDFRFGARANYVLHYKTSPVPGVALKDEVNHFGYPARFTGKVEAGVDIGGFSGTVFLNYVNSRTITRDFLPAAVPDQYQNIDPITTVDLSLRYNFGETGSMITNGLAASLNVLNVFDADPPLVVNAGGATPIRFDSSYSSSMGRYISFQLSKKF